MKLRLPEVEHPSELEPHDVNPYFDIVWYPGWRRAYRSERKALKERRPEGYVSGDNESVEKVREWDTNSEDERGREMEVDAYAWADACGLGWR